MLLYTFNQCTDIWLDIIFKGVCGISFTVKGIPGCKATDSNQHNLGMIYYACINLHRRNRPHRELSQCQGGKVYLNVSCTIHVTTPLSVYGLQLASMNSFYTA